MNEEKIKRMLDACYLAKRTRELLPELPEGVTPAYIQYMDVIHKLQEKKERVKVSDISDTLKLPRFRSTGGDKNGQGNGKKGLSHEICV